MLSNHWKMRSWNQRNILSQFFKSFQKENPCKFTTWVHPSGWLKSSSTSGAKIATFPCTWDRQLMTWLVNTLALWSDPLTYRTPVLSYQSRSSNVSYNTYLTLDVVAEESPENDEAWASAYSVDFRKRLINLLGFEFKNLPCSLAL